MTCNIQDLSFCTELYKIKIGVYIVNNNMLETKVNINPALI